MLLERLFVEIAADASKLEKGLRSADKDLMRFSQRIQNIGQSMSLWLTAPIAAIGGASVAAAASMESLELGLTAITGSASTAAQQLERLRELAKRPVIDLEIAAQSSMALQAIGKDAQFAERMIAGVGNAIALSGGGRSEFEGVMRQLRQVASLGRLMGEEMNIILENAPAMASAIQQAFGTTSTEAIRELGLTSDEFFERLMQGMESLPTAAAGSKTALENMAAAMRDAGAAIGEALLPFVLSLANGVTSLADSIRDMNPAVRAWGIAFAGVVAALGPMIMLVGQLTPALVALKGAGLALAPIFGYGGLLILGLTAVAALILETSRNTRELVRATADLEAAERRLANAQNEFTSAGVLRRLQERRLQLDSMGGTDRLSEVQRMIEERRRRGLGAAPLLEERDALLSVITAIRTLEGEYVRLSTAAATAAAATATTPSEVATLTEVVALLKEKVALETAGKVEETARVLDKKVWRDAADEIRQVADVSDRWTSMFSDSLSDVLFQVESITEAMGNLFAMLARELVGQGIARIAGAILNPVGAVTGVAVSSIAPAAAGGARVADFSGIADDAMLVATGRQFKEMMARGLRSLEDDGFRVKT